MKNIHYFVETKRGVQKYDPAKELERIDNTIARHERSIAKLHDERRELINRYNLNKGDNDGQA